jgi:small-conductance mechanosensitive channel
VNVILESLLVEGQALLDTVLVWVASPGFLIELATILSAGLLARWIGHLVVRFLNQRVSPTRLVLHGTIEVGASVAVSSLWLLFLWLAEAAARVAGMQMVLARGIASLLVAWIVIRLLSHVVRSTAWSRVIFVAAWSVAALQILGLLDQIEQFLAEVGFTYGEVRISALNVVRALIVLAILLWLGALLRRFLERRIAYAQNLTPTLQVLLVQGLKFLLPVLALLVALPVLGVNLTALTVLGGAVAIGAGLGLQRSVANLVSGFLLLSGGSIRPGDVIAVKDMSGAETFGRVASISAHYLSLRTRGGREYLIPNETFIINGVENWSHSDDRVRLKIPFGISYGCDPRLAMKLALEAAEAVPRVIRDPKPVCLLMGFGDSAIEFELRIWISDPMNGVANVKSDCLLEAWDRFQANNIHIPFPQRDLHLVSVAEGLPSRVVWPQGTDWRRRAE